MNGMVVKNDVDFEILIVFFVNLFQKINKVFAVMRFSDEPCHLSVQQIYPGKQ